MDSIIEGKQIFGEGEIPLHREVPPEDLEQEPNLKREKNEAEELLLTVTQLKELENEMEQAKDEAARARADYYNLRQRTARDASRQRALASETAVNALMPVLDNLDRALGAADKDDPLLKGVSMVRRQFFEALKELGLEEIAPQEEFDPGIHEAVGMVEVEDPELDGKVVDEFQRGYLLGGKVLRPSQVRIGTWPQEEA